MLFHCIERPHFVYPLSVDGQFGCFYLLPIVMLLWTWVNRALPLAIQNCVSHCFKSVQNSSQTRFMLQILWASRPQGGLPTLMAEEGKPVWIGTGCCLLPGTLCFKITIVSVGKRVKIGNSLPHLYFSFPKPWFLLHGRCVSFQKLYSRHIQMYIWA